MIDPRTPVLVGGGQLNRREDPVEPVDLIVEAVRAAASDAEAPSLTRAIDSVRIVGMLSWRYRDPGLLVGERLGAAVRHTVYTGNGGSYPQALVNEAAEDIAAGRCDVVVVGGAEAWRTRMRLKREGRRPEWTVQDEALEPTAWHPDVPMRHPSEVAAGLDRPAHVYPLFESALRIAAGRTPEAHLDRISRLWARFSEVAEKNPHAWTPRAHSAEQIATPSASNRMISSPYPKLMNSNNSVEQSAAVIVCSAAAAERWGVPRDRWVFLASGAEAADAAAIAARPDLHRSRAIRAAAAAALIHAGLRVEDLGPVDLYSCFPSAVQVAAQEVGLADDDPARSLTVTGGLTFAGGPWNNYSTHAIASMLDAVRETGLPGLVTANSGYLTKHAVGVYGPRPTGPFARHRLEPDVRPIPIRLDHEGVGTLEAWTVRYDREGEPDRAMASIRTGDGARVLAASDSRAVIDHLTVTAAEGASVMVSGGSRFELV
ncbi:acetyl-CoA acetyltransferase [Nocardioides sp. TRM66260-LWL]|uniref:acetyl-CoA acetyltransferase n=1 Tax=Nocardioides sp. TRM66260-LWL TaxID=2874478 RepID=UPI001CC34687|nr:acetyl-CoA acetyltransferase [Nocardioides sp. TRM66260-LWL]MBZ5735303.1 acetyl-CoA acetyltransferase [Nocardioides sp. TRM66260-LWL]